ncbi:hypothetical protein [Tsukamurella sp. 1534]|uniref:WXG100-like domain-containing protein n=1 Tax=Tsukamurella sp. 1534 TaxID=1151061 RepID=UPI0002EEF376|nr:hypothetical protein [Tsukamurella sp. 1534]
MSITETIDDATKGVPLAESVYEAVEGLAEQNPMQFAGNVFTGGIAVQEIVTDPVGTFFASGVGWIFEHVPALKSSLDAVSGNPDAIDDLTDTWEKQVAAPLAAVSSTVENAGGATASGWSGSDGNAYRAATARLAVSSDALSESARSAASTLAFAGGLVEEVRNFIRDELSKLCAWAVATWAAGAAASVPTGGASVVGATNTIVLRATALAQKFAGLLRTLTGKLQALTSRLGTLGDAVKALRVAGAKLDGAATATAKAVDNGAVVRTVIDLAESKPSIGAGDILLNGVVAEYKAAGDAWAADQGTRPA